MLTAIRRQLMMRLSVLLKDSEIAKNEVDSPI